MLDDAELKKIKRFSKNEHIEQKRINNTRKKINTLRLILLSRTFETVVQRYDQKDTFSPKLCLNFNPRTIKSEIFLNARY